MPINLLALGEKLSKYRSQLTVDLDEVAQATGIETGRLRLIEQGAAEPTGDEILIRNEKVGCSNHLSGTNTPEAPCYPNDSGALSFWEHVRADVRRLTQRCSGA
jgi:hypothetical protein